MKAEKVNIPNDNSEKLSNEYRQKYDLYSDFSEKVASILEQVLKDGGYKFQMVAFRAKNPASATMRFQEKKCSQLSGLKDLSGCRVIFYLESDINKFIQTIYDTFSQANITDYDPKISPDGYNAIHIVIRLGDDRLKHPEYKRYQGLLCEIQLTTVLHHAWSEMEHDIAYKPAKELNEFDSKAFNAIKQGFKNTMKEHIQPAMRDFEYLYGEHEKLKQGKGIFNIDSLKMIEESNSLNDLEDQLKLLNQYIDEFGDKTPTKLPLITLIKSILIKVETLKPQARKTVFGLMRGATRENVIMILLQILNTLRYWHIRDVCEICFNLVKEDKNKGIVSEATSVLDSLCKYDLRILNTGLYDPQQKAIKFLSRPEILNHPKTTKAISRMLKEILTLSFNGVKHSDYKSITFQPTSLNATPELIQLRTKAIKIAKYLFSKTKNIRDKKEIILLLEQGLRWPEHGVLQHADELESMLATDTRIVLNFYKNLLKQKDFEVIQEIEHHLWFLEKDPKRKNTQTSRLLLDISNNQEYQIFKIFAGYDTSFYPDFDFEKAKLYRDQKINEFLTDFTPKTLGKWINILKKITKNYKHSDPGFFNQLNFFLFELSKLKPNIGLMLIKEKTLQPFLIHIVAGIWKSPQKAVAKKLISKWCNSYQYLNICAGIFDYVEEIDEKLLKQILIQAVNKKDVRALNTITASICRNYDGQASLRKMFLYVVSVLTELKDTYWTNHVWFRKNSITKDFSEKDFKILTKNLLLRKTLDYDIEQILEPMVEKYPENFIDFLFERVKISLKFKKPGDLNRYDAIPYNFNRLGDSLRSKAQLIIPKILKWYSLGTPKKDQWLYRWEAGHLLKDIFPNSDPQLEKELIKLIKHSKESTEIVIDQFISRFHGEEFIWRLIEEIVNTLKGSKEYENTKRQLFGYLSQTGVVSGEYGFVEAFQSKKTALDSIKKTHNKVLLKFVQEYEDYLDKQIAIYQKMADDDIDRRKKEFGS